MEFNLLIFKNQLTPVKYSIGQMNKYQTKIMILVETKLQGLKPDEPDYLLRLKLNSEDFQDIFNLGWLAGKEPIHFSF